MQFWISNIFFIFLVVLVILWYFQRRHKIGIIEADVLEILLIVFVLAYVVMRFICLFWIRC